MDVEELYIVRCGTPHNINLHMPLLKWLAKQCDHITEFGTDEGYSTVAFMAASPKVIRTYDIASRHKNFEVVLDSVPRNVRLIVHRENTLYAVIEETDLLFIDTEHTYDQVKSELELHGNKSKKYIVLHDIVAFPCIVPAILEWLDSNSNWFISTWSLLQSGMAVLTRR